MILKKTLLASCCLLLSTLCFAQQDSLPTLLGMPDPSTRAPLTLVPWVETDFPLGDFKEKMDRSVFIGKGIGLFYRLKKHPVDLGLRFGGLRYEKIRRNYTDPISNLDLLQKTKCKIWFWEGVFRFEPPVTSQRLQPYLEASGGWRRYYVRTFKKERGVTVSSSGDTETNGRFDQETLHSDWGWLISGAAGLKYIFEDYGSSFDFQIGYRQGATGDFYVRNETAQLQPDPLDNFDRQRAGLSVVSLKIGFFFLIREMK